MATGTVKWFNHEKGFGFITPDEAGRDLFVHQSQVEGGGALADGAKVDYESEPAAALSPSRLKSRPRTGSARRIGPFGLSSAS